MTAFELKDVQNRNDTRGVNIQMTGIRDLDVPLIICGENGEKHSVCAKAKMSVSLPANLKGTHMSRFVEILGIYAKKGLSEQNIKCLLQDTAKNLKSKSAYAKFDFKYFVDKKSPVTKLSFPFAYDCYFCGNLTESEFEFFVGVKVPVTTLCPCSKEISEMSAHNQRATIKIKIKCEEENPVKLEELIKIAEECASAPVYPLLKRSDEKFVTEKAYENPKFVEDVIRDLVLQLRNNEKIKAFEAWVEALESIHNHNAWAYRAENFDGEGRYGKII